MCLHACTGRPSSSAEHHALTWHACAAQAYPAGGGLADAMAANELAAHCSLGAEGDAQHVCALIGGFASERGATAGEQVPAPVTLHSGVPSPAHKAQDGMPQTSPGGFAACVQLSWQP